MVLMFYVIGQSLHIVNLDLLSAQAYQSVLFKFVQLFRNVDSRVVYQCSQVFHPYFQNFLSRLKDAAYG